MSEKILIFEDKGKQQTFLKDAEAVRDAANTLALTFQDFQPFKIVSTLEDFELLCSDPVQYFDETLKANVSLKMTGNRQPDPQVLADLFGIERQNYISLIKGLPVTEDCKPCQTSRVIRKKSKPALSFNEYTSYKSFLTFELGAFNLNTEAIAARQEQYKTFAETEAEVKLYRHFEGLASLLNEHDKQYSLSNLDKQSISKGLHLHLSEAYMGKFMINQQYVLNEIIGLKYKNK